MIYMIFTTCINARIGVHSWEERKNRYLNSFPINLEMIKPFEIKPIIVENNGQRETYLDQFGDVIYTNSNATIYHHKGFNELDDLKTVIDRCGIQDDDVVIKITGRYELLSSSFIELVIKEQQNYDAFVKFFNVCTLQFMEKDCVLGLFAIKAGLLKAFSYNNPYTQSPEVEFATYCRTLERLCEVQTLNIKYHFGTEFRTLDV